MTANSIDTRTGQWSAELSAGAAALFVLLLTSVHHVWGAVVFDTPWRLHIVFISIPVAIAIAGLLYGARRSESAWANEFRWIAALVILVFPILMIGFYEGGYNHVFKNILYFASGEAAARAQFASETYEMPSDFVFEATGVLQFPAAVVALRMLLPLVWRRG